MLVANNSDPSSNPKFWKFLLSVKSFYFLLLIFCLSFSCSKSKETTPEEFDKKNVSATEKDDSFLEDSKGASKNVEGFTPTNPITEASSERFLEYKIYLVFKTKDLLTARKELLSIIQQSSILKRSEFSLQNELETLQIEILTPVSNLYPSLLELSKVGKLVSEKVETIDWTEHNQRQKITLERESLRAQRRAKAGQEGSATNWTWKEREELLERSENNYD
ncbi:MAG: hypothetical protein N3A69_11290, partial [Leptospiraceae bacterium]|nr:hypothetical protein [Leptospiraceae bacterium]